MDKQPIERSALLVIDVQDSFRLDEARWATRNNPGFEANLTRLIDAYRQAGLPVIWVVHEDGDAMFRAESPFVRLQPFLDRRDDEPLLRKNTRNAFTSTDLAERLAVLGVRRIAVTGIQTEQCCETTARVAGEELARNLLNDPRLTVEAVAARCGFETPRQLRRVWKEAFGTTPRAAALQPNA